MTYQPLAETYDTGTAYFESLGLIGGSTGMEPLVTASTTFPAFDDYDGADLTITDSVAKSTSGSATISWSGYDLSAAKTKLLMTVYCQPSNTDWIGIGCHTGTLPATTLQDDYLALLYGNASGVYLARHVSPSGWIVIGTDTTMWQEELPTQPVWGIGLYVDQSNPGSEVQKLFVKSGSGQWLQLLDAANADHSSFQSIVLYNRGHYCRYITPIMVWGA